MKKTMIRLATAILTSGMIIAAAAPACSAGTRVQITFSGSNFSGCLQYDQSQGMESPHYFKFEGPTFNHEVCYQLTGGSHAGGSNLNCEPYAISTSLNSNTTFQLKATSPAATTVVVTLPANVTFGLAQLPLCMSGSTSGIQEHGNIPTHHHSDRRSDLLRSDHVGQLQPTGNPNRLLLPSATRLHPVPVSPPAGPSPSPEPGLTYVYTQLPVNECAQRPSCCFTRFMSRWSHRNRCR